MTVIPYDKLKQDLILTVKLANRGREVYQAAKEALHLFEPMGKDEKKLTAKLIRAIRRFEEADR